MNQSSIEDFSFNFVKISSVVNIATIIEIKNKIFIGKADYKIALSVIEIMKQKKIILFYEDYQFYTLQLTTENIYFRPISEIESYITSEFKRR